MGEQSLTETANLKLYAIGTYCIKEQIMALCLSTTGTHSFLIKMSSFWTEVECLLRASSNTNRDGLPVVNVAE